MTKGLLLVMMNPPERLEEEFNAWYDMEHVPERLAVPGIETAIRYICNGGGPKYLALYDLEAPEVLESEGYLAVSGGNFSPWTRRVTSWSRVHRAACTQIHPDGGISRTGACVQLLRFRNAGSSDSDAVLAGLKAAYGGDHNIEQMRLYHYELDGVSYLIAVVEFTGTPHPPDNMSVFGSNRTKIDLCAGYRPYAY